LQSLEHVPLPAQGSVDEFRGRANHVECARQSAVAMPQYVGNVESYKWRAYILWDTAKKLKGTDSSINLSLFDMLISMSHH